MTLDQLRRADFFIGPVNMKERMSRSNPRGLAHRFISNLIGERTTEDLSSQSDAAYRRTYGEAPKPSSTIREMYRKEADRVEREIWNAQQKKGCSISGNELVARDAAREGQPAEIVNRARGKRKAIIR
jgi:hypothetical protein